MYERVWYESARHPDSRLALHWWKNAGGSQVPARGYVWIVHGLGEHGGRYAEFATFLTGLGFDVLAPDLPGHGLSRTEGNCPRQHSITDNCDELDDLLRYWVTKGPSAKKGGTHTPWFLVGHSLGGLTALAWILRGKRAEPATEFARKAFISAPPLRLRLQVPSWKVSLARSLRSLAPHLKIPNGIKAEDLSYDAVNVAAYKADPLVHGAATPIGFCSMVETVEEVLARPGDVEIPVCLAVGADDPIVDPTAVRQYFDALGTHKKFLEFPRSKHEILNEIGRSRCYEAAAAWFL